MLFFFLSRALEGICKSKNLFLSRERKNGKKGVGCGGYCEPLFSVVICAAKRESKLPEGLKYLFVCPRKSYIAQKRRERKQNKENKKDAILSFSLFIQRRLGRPPTAREKLLSTRLVSNFIVLRLSSIRYSHI